MVDSQSSRRSSDGARKALRTLFIGLGGTGNEVIRRVKRDMTLHGFDLPVYQYLVMDTMPYHEDTTMDPDKHLRNHEEYLYIGGYNPNQIIRNIDNWPVVAHWWGDRTTSNLVTVDEGAGQMRAVGRMGFFRHFKDIRSRLDQMVHESTSAANREAAMAQGFDVPTQRDPVVYIVFSLCGGTGSSLFFDVAYVLRQLFAPKIKPTIVGIAMLPGPYVQSIGSIPQHERIQANAYAALQELERLHDMALGNRPDRGADIWQVDYASNFRVSSSELPFDYLYLIDDTSTEGERYTAPQLWDLMGQAIFWQAGPSTSVRFWERAKNLISPTLAAGGTPDRSGRPRLAKYSSFGIAVAGIDWRKHWNREEGLVTRALLTNLCDSRMEKTPALPAQQASAEALLMSASQGFLPSEAQTLGTFRTRESVRDYFESARNRYSMLPIRRQPAKWTARLQQVHATLVEEITTTLRATLTSRGPVAGLETFAAIRSQVATLQNDLEAIQADANSKELEAKTEIATTDGAVRLEWAPVRYLRAVFALARQAYHPDNHGEERRWTGVAQDGTQSFYKLALAQHRYQASAQIIAQVVTPAMTLLDDIQEPLERLKRDVLDWRAKLNEEVRNREKQEAFEREHGSDFEPIIPVSPELDQGSAIDRLRQDGSLRDDAIQRLFKDVLEPVFRHWPAERTPFESLRSAIRGACIDLLKQHAQPQSVLERLVAPDAAEIRQRFLDRPNCLWSFQEDATQEVMQQIERISLIGVGEDVESRSSNGQLAKKALDFLMRDQDPTIERASTGILDEIALLKTMHGLQVTYLRGISDLQTAYQIMRVVRGAPYLHLDNTLWAEQGYGPLSELVRTPNEIIRSLEDAAQDIQRTDKDLGDAVAQATQAYASQLATYSDGSAQRGSTRRDEAVKLKLETNPLFTLIESLEYQTARAARTSGVRAVLMELVTLIELAHVQGWIRIIPVVGERFRPDLYGQAGAAIRVKDMQPGHVAAVIHGGFWRQEPGGQPGGQPQVRPALVQVSA